MAAKVAGKVGTAKSDGQKREKISLRGELKRFTRERLISVALDCFAENGFSETTVERIADLAGTTTPTFYRHFESKIDLLVPMQQALTVEVKREIAKLDDIELTFAAVRRWLDEYGQMWQRMRRLCSAYWEACAIHQKLAQNTLLVALDDAEQLEKLVARYPDKASREGVKMRVALMIPVLDRVFQTVDAVADERTRMSALDEFAMIILLALQHGDPSQK